jgi:hypothetical protein
VAAHGAGQAHPAPRQLLDHGREAPYGHVDPTELGRNQQAEDAELLHRVDEVLRIAVVVFEVADAPPDFTIHPGRHRGNDLQLVGIEIREHTERHGTLRSRGRPSTRSAR